MTTFTTDDRKSVYKHDEPTHIVDSGASVDDREDSMQMLRDQLHAQNSEIKALRKALMYNRPKELTDEEIHKIAQEYFHAGLGISPLDFARAILKKAQEK